MGKGGDTACDAAGLGAMLGRSFSFGICQPRYLERVQTVEAVDAAAWEYLLAGWAGDLSKLSPQAQSVLLLAVPEVHNLVFKERPFLAGRCSDYCSQLAHRLDEQGIEVRMIGGMYFDDMLPGTTIQDLENQVAEGDETEEIFDWGSHTWLEIEDQLIDPTAGQFFQDKNDIEWSHTFYMPSQMKMHSFLEEWEGPSLHLGDRILYGPDGLRVKT